VGQRPNRLSTFFLRSKRVVTSEVRAAAIEIAHGSIVRIVEYDAIPNGVMVDDVGDLVVMPGLVDTHVHVNEPGRTEWEGFETITRAAAAGGTTTIVDMPLNSIPATIDVPSFEVKLAAARGNCWVDTGFWGGLVDDNRDQLEPLARAGVLGFKAFLVPSGVPEFAAASIDDVQYGLPTLRELGVPLLVHAELPEAIEHATAELLRSGADPCTYECYLRSRPPLAELQAIARMIMMPILTGAHVHIVHLSSAEALPMLRSARARGLPITVETCPHYLYFSSNDIRNGATEFKCAPPIRDANNREALMRGLEDGTIDMVVSDHSPCTPEMKNASPGDFMRAWGGIASVQLRLSIMLAVIQNRGVRLPQLARWLCSAPAELAGLSDRKGAIAPGQDADFVVFDPEAEQTVEPATLQHRHKLTPYAGHTLPGVVHSTYLRGRKIFDGTAVGEKPAGTLILRRAPL
jgi:allantoinase